MPAHTQKDALLKITLDPDGTGTATPIDISCQVINAEFTPASNGEGEIIPTACGDTVVEPGDPQPGSLSGEVFKDTTANGITRLLLKAVETASTFEYVYTENEGTPEELKYTGKASVPAFAVPFAPTKFGRHSISLSIATSVLADAHAAVVTP